MNKSTLAPILLIIGIMSTSLATAGLIVKLAVIMRYRYIAGLFGIGAIILVISYFMEEGE